MESGTVGWAFIVVAWIVLLVGFFLLCKLATRWPRWESWLGSGAVFVCVFAAVLLLGPAFAVWWFVVAAIVWNVLKRRTRWLDAPGKDTGNAAASGAGRTTTAAVSVELPAPRAAPTPAPAQPRAAPRPSALPANDRIFVSYRRSDSADVTGRIYDRLVQRFGKEQIFKDVDSIPLGLDFREYVGEVVGRCNLLLAVVGDQWLAANAGGTRRIDDPKDLVRIEIEAALARKIPVVPVLVRGASVPEEQELPPSLAGLTYRNGIKVRSDPDFHHDMDRLIAGMEAHLHPRA